MNGRLHNDLKDADVEQGIKDTIWTSARLLQYLQMQDLQKKQEDASGQMGMKRSTGPLSTKSVRFSLYSNPTELPPIKRHVNTNNVKNIISDWIYLAVLGVCTAFLSILVDMIIYYCQEVQALTYPSIESKIPMWTWILSFFSWCTYMVGLTCCAATFTHYVSQQAIGSGIPEMKTIIRGVRLKDYLTFRTLVSKVFGVAMALASGIPIGKLGPFVHIGSVVSNQLAILASKFDVAFASETRRAECLAAGCAVGVACTFSAPVGGVLFSIEVTTMYFSVRSYWRGFFAACCGAITIRLLRGFVAQTEVTVNAFFQTSFTPDAFVVDELPLFAVLGIVCGVLGAVFITIYRNAVLFLRNNKYAKRIFQQHWIVYPAFISFLYSIVSFPHGLGMFATGRLKFGMNLKDFFSNCTFSEPAESFLACRTGDVYIHWLHHEEDVLGFLALFVLTHLVFSSVCMSLPIPSGVFMPIFVIGASIGRLFGEMVAVTIPPLVGTMNIYPGVYAVVGAASFSASVTHTVSVSVMMFEITGQLHCILPVIMSVLISNAVCAYLTPSFFDTIIKIKHLPFLPDIPPSSNVVHIVQAENIMVSPVQFVTKIISYADIQQTLMDGDFRVFPVVDSAESQMLIGTISRSCLTELLEAQVGEEARKEEAGRRVRKAIETIDMHFRTSFKEIFEQSSKSPSPTNTRTKSESSLPKFMPTPPSTLAHEDEKKSHKNKNRFTVSPGHIEPANRKSSPTRRNAFCSLETGDKTKEEAEEDEKSCGSDRIQLKQHLTLHGIDYHTVVKSYMRQAKKYLHHMQFGHSKPERKPLYMYDLSDEEQRHWEAARLAEEVDLTEDVDPAPFQIVKKTSLFNIHSIFSMLQLSRVYVTERGRLIGVISLSDLREELERHSGKEKPATTESIVRQGMAAHAARTAPLLQRSTTVVDILTPMPEVVNWNAFDQSSDDDSVRSDPTTPQLPPHLSRRRSSHIVERVLTERSTRSARSELPRLGTSHEEKQAASQHEDFVEAVAYLRKKSLTPDQFRTLQTPFM
ncbi:unnamed protein product [Cylicocyclus nassatus]|uniref:Chloride channel protein n=1 Tax=Cylicocyclus nassatus TaxID=53992 RepID=A0AA36HG04_CYLNA|nr:unnamed protein product [Cylicocyclus nassatus]